jgi:hypothetical protein
MIDKQPLILSDLPLEVRHRIFEYVAIRTTKPKKLLRSWFENQETSELAAKYVAANPGCLSPIVVQSDGSYDSPDTDEEHGDEGDYHEDDDGGEDGDSDDYDENEDSYDEDEVEDSGVIDGVVHSNTLTQTLPPAPQFRPQRKWRHIPKVSSVSFLRMPKWLLMSSSVHAYYSVPTPSRDFPRLQATQLRGKELVLRCFRATHRGNRQLRPH